ncbi:MAG: EcsC family protein, partial [Pedobacter sp.]
MERDFLKRYVEEHKDAFENEALPPNMLGNILGNLKEREEREERVRDRIAFYKTAGAAEGGVTGAGGILLGLADFPLLLALKMKLLFEIAAIYGYPVNEYKERLYIMHIFQLAFSSQERRQFVYQQMLNWQAKSQQLPDDIDQFDWR